MKSNGKKVLIGLSGGVDSAVSAYLLLENGYRVEGAFMKNWSATEGLIKNECPWLQDRQEALRVAAFLDIPLHTLDFEKPYQKQVMEYFFREYQEGRTPNPDVMCNKEIKFKLLYDWARRRGFDYLATGHYARIGYKKGLPVLLRSVDEFKDQTYFIYNIKTAQLPHLLFPIGGMKKTAVKKLAEKIGLPNAGRKESMGLCFVGKIRLKEFLAQKLKAKPGLILGPNGEKLGLHEGLSVYTIGQRQGIKVGAGGPFFVFKKDLKRNTLHVTNNPEDDRLFVKELQIHSVNWINSDYIKPAKSLRLQGRYRHQGELVDLRFIRLKKDLYQVIFDRPQKAVASGQSLVLYKGKECVGGGVIA